MKRAPLLIACIILLLPSIAWAIFNTPATDKSLEYLGIIFGRMGYLPLANSGNILFSKVMLLFNQIVLALATIIVIYTVVSSTIHTAHEGEIMGKKWSSIFIPARIGAGLWLLVPASSGYSYIQIIIMWFILQGVGVANTLWEQVLVAYDQGQGIYSTVDISELSVEDEDVPQSSDNALKGIFKSQICLALVNSNAETLDQINRGTPLSVFKSADGTRIMWGIESTEQPICGYTELPEKTIVDKVYNAISGGATDAQFEQFRSQIGDLIINGLNSDLKGAAQEAVNSPPDQWRNFGNLITAQSNYKQGKQDLITRAASGGSAMTSTLAKDALADGWVHAGSYYGKLIAGNQSTSPSLIAIRVAGPNFNLIGAGDVGITLSQKTDSLSAQYIKKATEDRNATDASAGRERAVTSASSLPFPLDEIMDALSSPFWGLAKTIMKKMSNNDGADPILSISKMGGQMVSATEGIFFTFTILALGALLALGWFSAFSSIPHVLPKLFSILLPIFMLLLAFFYSAGIMMALYIPLIPFLVFTFSVIGWMILVIEAIVAAPLVAMILVVPSEDELGKVGHSLVILLGLILRPPLMILGFIVAIKFLLIGVKLLNFGFATVVYDNRPAFSLFFPVAVVVLYAGTLTYIVHEAFSLIYVIPDKVLRWMGGTPETEDVMGKVKKAEGDVEKGAGSAKSGMGAAASAGKQGIAKGK